MLNHKVTVHCATCNEKLWVYFRLDSGHPVIVPAQPESPRYRISIRACPFCGQDYRLAGRLWVKDAESGQMHAA